MLPKHFAQLFPTLLAVLLFVGCGRQKLTRQELPAPKGLRGEVTIHGDVWADNWFALYLGEELLIEDSVSITTERSFNAESFSFKADYPIVLNFVVKDFKENDSGLEYIGTKKQQLGDGGFIAQFKDASTGELLVATNTDWKCYVLHHGPIDESCASEASPIPGKGVCDFIKTPAPTNWKSPNFSVENWDDAKEFSESEVRPKDGYDQVDWSSKSKLIWANDLKKDNTILFRVVIERPKK